MYTHCIHICLCTCTVRCLCTTLKSQKKKDGWNSRGSWKFAKNPIIGGGGGINGVK